VRVLGIRTAVVGDTLLAYETGLVQPGENSSLLS
jgi:hypothetical protein